MTSFLPDKFKNSLINFRDDLDSFFTDWLQGKGNIEKNLSKLNPFAEAAFPIVDIKNSENEILIAAEMPGLEKDDFNVEITGKRLKISGEKKKDREEKDKEYYFKECSYGSFSRIIELPSEVDPEKVEASYKNGVLKITLPKIESEKAKKIEIKTT